MKQIERLYSPSPTSSIWAKVWYFGTKEACKRGNLPIAQWLLEHPIGRAVCAAMRDERLGEGNDFLYLAAAGGHLPTMALLQQQGAVKSPYQFEQALVIAVRNGHLPAAGWLLHHYPYSPLSVSGCVVEEAIKRGRLDILKYFHRLRSSTDRPVGFVVPASVEIVIRAWWARAGAMMNIAAKYGRLEVVKWLHGKYPDACSSKAMDDAATNGHLNVVQWLHANRLEGCTRKAMNRAAANGHLEVFQWLHINTTAGCTTHAMDLAAGRGHLKMLKWLQINWSEGCIAKAVNNALEQCHLRVLSWLHHNVTQLIPSRQDCHPRTQPI